MGDLSLYAIHFFQIGLLQGRAVLCELVWAGFEELIDVYKCPIKEYWFKFSSATVTEPEQTCNDYLETLLNGKPE